MDFIKTTEQRLVVFFNKLTENKKTAFVTGIVLYTIIFALFFSITLLAVIKGTGTLLGGDGVAQYYPCLLDFRRNLISFFESAANGSLQPVTINFDYCFGTDTFTSSTLMFLPFFPFYALSALIAEAHVPMLFAVGAIILSYFSGISFLYLCSYFKQNMLWSGFFAAFYVFCGNYFFTAIYNPQFLYMFIAFPLMIVGMDKIVKGRSWAVLTVSVFWLSLSGFLLLVYTIPFIVVFAIIRVYFLYRKAFFRNLSKYFLRGCLAVLFGIFMAGVAVAPSVVEFFESTRTDRIVSLDFASLFIPSTDAIKETLDGANSDSPTGICAALIPCFLYAFTSAKTKAEIKCHSFIMLLLVALPVIRYGLNGFQYDLCRWGFVPALLICFICVKHIPALLHTSRTERSIFIFTLSVYVIGLTFKLDEFAIVFMLAMALINSVPPLKKLLLKAVEFIRKSAAAIKSKNGKKSKFSFLVAATFGGFAVVMLVIYAIAWKRYEFIPALLIAAIATGALIIPAAKRNYKAVSSVALALIYLVSSVIYFVNTPQAYYILDSDEFLDMLSAREYTPNTFGRTAYIIDNRLKVDYFEQFKKTETAAESVAEEAYNVCFYINTSLILGFPSCEVFRSTINGHLMNFLKRCGMDYSSILATSQVVGFSDKEVIYSLFGADILYSDSLLEYYYGVEPSEVFTRSDGSSVQLYHNKYALPVGVTYDRLMDADRFEALNSAELPYAMMNSIYLEGYDYSEDTEADLTQYSIECDFDLTQQLRGETDFAIKCYDNYIDVKNDVSDCFLYLCFEGVNVTTYKGAKDELFNVNVDNRFNCNFYVHNQNFDWEWNYTTDHYAFSLGHINEDINEITFVSPFEFEKVSLYAIPSSVYTGGYSQRCQEILEDVSMSGNALTGNITVSEDKILSVNMLYNKGWTAYVDGAKAPLYKANGLFIGIPLNEGTHTIRLEYRSPGLYEGVVMSLTGIALFAVLQVLSRRKKSASQSV